MTSRAAALFLSLAVAGCDDAPGQWSAIVYPDGADRTQYSTTHRFKSLSMCRQAAHDSIAALPDPARADYRCGYQCESPPGEPGRNVCKSVQK